MSKNIKNIKEEESFQRRLRWLSCQPKMGKEAISKLMEEDAEEAKAALFFVGECCPTYKEEW